MCISTVQMSHSAIRNIILLYQQNWNQLKNKNVIKNSMISELVRQVNRNCLSSCHMSGPCELGNRNTCHLFQQKLEFYEFLIM